VSEDTEVKELNAYSAQLLRELVIPAANTASQLAKRLFGAPAAGFYSLVLATMVQTVA
jgi:hypothetical protein